MYLFRKPQLIFVMTTWITHNAYECFALEGCNLFADRENGKWIAEFPYEIHNNNIILKSSI